MSEKRERIILGLLFIYFTFLLIGPIIIPQKNTFKMKIIAINCETFPNLECTRLYYRKTRLASIEGTLCYVPYGRLEFIGMWGIYPFEEGHAYEIQYKPVRRHQRGTPQLVEVKELTT